MKIFNVVFKHIFKNIEICVGISIKKHKLADKETITTLRIQEMDVFNIVFKRTSKNFELSVGISIKKLRPTNALEIVQK